MDRKRFTTRSLAGLVVLILFGAVPASAGPKDTLDQALDKAHEMFGALYDNKDFSVAKELGESSLKLIESALKELESMEGQSGVHDAESNASDARDWMIQALRDVKDENRSEAEVHAAKTKKSLDLAISSLK